LIRVDLPDPFWPTPAVLQGRGHALGIAGQGHAGEAGEHLLQEDACLQPRQRRADASVLPEAERQDGRLGWPGDVELVRVVPALLIPIRGEVQQVNVLS